MKETVMMLVCVCKQAAIKIIFDALYTLLYIDISTCLCVTSYDISGDYIQALRNIININNQYHRFTKQSSIKCVAVLLQIILMIPTCIYFQKAK